MTAEQRLAKRVRLARDLEAAHALADAVLSRARRSSARHAPSRKAKALTRQERGERTHRIWVEVMKRSGGKCETCGHEANEDHPLQMHHLLPGRGRRTQEQDVSNCIAVCMWCHEFGHGRILYLETGLMAWAKRYGYTETAKNIQRRIDKALIADPSWPRDEEQTRRLGPGTYPTDSKEPTR